MFVVNNLNGFNSLPTEFLPEATTLFAAMDVQPSYSRKLLINSTIQAFITSSTWASLDILYVMAAHDEQASRLNWKSPGNFTLTGINSPTFTVDRGWAGNGTSSYLDTGWDPVADAVNFVQNASSGSVYQRTNGSGTGIGFQQPFVLNNSFVAKTAGTDSRTRVNATTLGQNPNTAGIQPLWRAGSRQNSSTTIIPYLDGVAGAGLTMNSVVLSSVSMMFGRGNAVFTNAEFCAGHMGGLLSNQQASDMYNALYIYMLAVQADSI